jgi:biotin carboxyl carrier protein
MARERVRAAEQAVDAARAARETSRLNVERQRQLSSSGLVSRRQLEVAELEYTRAGTEAERAEAALAAARNEERALLADQAKVGTDAQASVTDAQAARATADAEAANAFAELARIDVRLARQNAQRVTAPMDGTILRMSGAIGGEMVKAGDVLAVIVPDTESRAVELWMDGNDVPLLSEGRLYYYKEKTGLLTCVDARTGRPHFETVRIPGVGRTYASPVAAGGHVYLTDRSGRITVIRDADTLEVVAENDIGEGVDATPAPSGDSLFVRGERRLFRFAAP